MCCFGTMKLHYIAFQTDIYEVCPSPLVLAQQLTHIELERLSMIGPEEFVQAFAKESEKVQCSLRKCQRQTTQFWQLDDNQSWRKFL